MFVQDGFLYLIVTKHKLTVWNHAAKEGPLSYVLQGSPFALVSKVSTGHAPLYSLSGTYQGRNSHLYSVSPHLPQLQR